MNEETTNYAVRNDVYTLERLRELKPGQPFTGFVDFGSRMNVNSMKMIKDEKYKDDTWSFISLTEGRILHIRTKLEDVFFGDFLGIPMGPVFTKSKSLFDVYDDTRAIYYKLQSRVSELTRGK